MPRIRNWKDLKFYKSNMETKFQNIEKLFTNEAADWELIEKYLHEMFQIAQSIMAGTITPSAILRRLGTNSKKNKIFQAFSALGRVVRTAYLLDYLTDVELRQVVHAATVKCEQFNNFVQWIHFAREYIKTVEHDEQVKVIKYNHLIAVSLSFWNAWNMTEKIDIAKNEGYEFGPNEIERMSPYRTKHVNRFGKVSLEFSPPLPVDYGLGVKSDFASAP